MKTIYHFFRLIRTTNLLVIGLTMLVVEVFLLRYDSLNIPDGYLTYSVWSYHYSELMDFLPLVISTILIAAAGNIINDYFDVKADRINKPKRLIIGKHIKRRWAMVLHWSFNSIGMIIALYVGYVLQNIWVPLIAFLSINLLWFYSAYYKRKPLIGNVIVALLLGVIPVYVLVFNMSFVFENDSASFILVVILGVSAIAFFMNLVRELVKDIQDIRGDLRLGAKTFPIRFGIKKTKWIIGLISVIVILIVVVYFYFILIASFTFTMFATNNSISIDIFNALIFSSAFLFLLSVTIVLLTKKNRTYKIGSTLLKIAMLFGLLTPLFL